MSLRSISTDDLERELEYRRSHPEWFIRDLVYEGYDLDNDEFREATDWIDDKVNLREREL